MHAAQETQILFCAMKCAEQDLLPIGEAQA